MTQGKQKALLTNHELLTAANSSTAKSETKRAEAAPPTIQTLKTEPKAWPGPFNHNTASDSDFSFSFSSEPGSCLETPLEDATPESVWERPSPSPAIKKLLAMWDTIHGPSEFIV